MFVLTHEPTYEVASQNRSSKPAFSSSAGLETLSRRVGKSDWRAVSRGCQRASVSPVWCRAELGAATRVAVARSAQSSAVSVRPPATPATLAGNPVGGAPLKLGAFAARHCPAPGRPRGLAVAVVVAGLSRLSTVAAASRRDRDKAWTAWLQPAALAGDTTVTMSKWAHHHAPQSKGDSEFRSLQLPPESWSLL